MKLSEAQARVLRTMVEYELNVWVEHWRGELTTLFDEEELPPGSRLHASSTILRRLESKGYLERGEVHNIFDYVYRVTPKGREVAKELEERDARG